MRRFALFVLAAALLQFATAREADATCLGLGCSCSVTASDVAFGAFEPLDNSALDSTGIVEVTCGALVLGLLVAYDIELSTGGAGGFVPRRMSNGTHTLNYNLYRDAGRTQVWGNGGGGTFRVSDSYLLTVNNTKRSYTIHGRIPATPDARPGAIYTDNLVARIIF